jgi:hypothetical protein
VRRAGDPLPGRAMAILTDRAVNLCAPIKFGNALEIGLGKKDQRIVRRFELALTRSVVSARQLTAEFQGILVQRSPLCRVGLVGWHTKASG